MKNSWHIFTEDWRNIITNWVVAVVIGGLIILPSLYAWFNIKASWDPYSQTDQIPVGVVNEDIGATIRGNDLDVGGELIDTLKENKSFEWHFLKREEALDDLEYGDLYAVIIIPKDLSEKLGSVVSDHPEKAHIDYYVNEKINAIAPKITGKGASVIAENISSQFVSTVNGVIFDIFNEIGLELEKDLPNINQFEEYVFMLEEKMPSIKEQLDQTYTDAEQAEKMLQKAEGALPEVERVTKESLQKVNNAKTTLQTVEEHWHTLAPIIKDTVHDVQKEMNQLEDYFTKVEDQPIDLNKVKEKMQHVDQQFSDGIKKLDNLIHTLETKGQSEQHLRKQHQSLEKDLTALKEQLDHESQDTKTIEQVIDLLQTTDHQSTQQITEDLKKFKGHLEQIQVNVNQLNDVIKTEKPRVEETLRTIRQLTKQANQHLDKFLNEFAEKVEPKVNQVLKQAHQTLDKALTIIQDVQTALPEVKQMIGKVDKELKEGKDGLNQAINRFPVINNKVKELANRLRKINEEADLAEIINLLQNDPEAEQSFFAEPVVLHENKVFPIENYGTGMTPFYTVLAIWVGGLLLISVVTTEGNRLDSYTFREAYFGRLYTFLSISLLQTLIVTVGDLYPIGVHAVNPVWFVVFGLYTSLIFMTIIYTLVSVLGDIGKAVAIVMLVLQIAGSGGTYPVVLLPEFFQKIHPFLPFTYAVGLMREAIGGIVWERVIHDILFLTLFAILALILGAFLKEPINKHSRELKNKSQESGLFP
ncbi:MAG TPA: YhgE/Pip domain-containing protein [Cerasibacillus sp.]|uniref:YhgE/Pip domain-containing protein n=1 Tax=Cerasibacillus sp. TaxID=2498711 RepID=UPI002F41BDBD